MPSETAISESALSEGGTVSSSSAPAAHFGNVLCSPTRNATITVELTRRATIFASPDTGPNK